MQVTPGLTNWMPASKQCDLYPDYQAVPEEVSPTTSILQTVSDLRADRADPAAAPHVPPARGGPARPGEGCPAPAPPPGPGSTTIPGLYSTVQNTGGFFIALLEKVSPCPWERDREAGRARHLEKVQQEEEKEENGAETAKPSNPGREPPAKRQHREYRYKEILFYHLGKNNACLLLNYII